MKTKYVNKYDKPCKRIKWENLDIGDYFFLDTMSQSLCLKIGYDIYYDKVNRVLSPIHDYERDNLGEVKVEVLWEKIFDKENYND